MTALANEAPRIHAFTVTCATSDCPSRLRFAGGEVPDFLQQLETAHHDGWLCAMDSVLDVTCPHCNTPRRRLQMYQVMRRRLERQPEWKRNIVALAWAAMADVHDDAFLRDTEMLLCLDALLGSETTVSAEHVRRALEQAQRSLETRTDLPNAVEAARLARLALRR